MSTSIDDLLKRGFGYVLAAEVEGIGVVFAERVPLRVDAASTPTLPTNYTAASGSLLIQDGQSVSVEMDPDTGCARGGAWEMLLSWEALEDESLLATLFKRATLVGRLSGSLAWNATSIQVDDTTGWPSSGTAYLGRERIDYTGIDSGTDTFTGCTRGVLGYNYSVDGNDPGDFRTLMNIPAIWRGRFVTLHQHIVSPEGRMLDSTWLSGTYHRELWKGYIDSPPVPDAFGMRLRCLPLVRALSHPFGAAESMSVLAFGESVTGSGEEAPGEYPIAFGDNDAAAPLTVNVWYRDLSDGSITMKKVALGQWSSAWDSIYTGKVIPLQTWIDKVSDDINTKLVTGGPFVGSAVAAWCTSLLNPDTIEDVTWGLHYTIADYEVLSVELNVAPWCYWIAPNETLAAGMIGPFGVKAWALLRFRWAFRTATSGTYIPVKLDKGDALLPSSVTAPGLGWLAAGADELVRWDEVIEPSYWPEGALLRVSERDVGWSYLSAHMGSGGAPSNRQRIDQGGGLSVVLGDIATFYGALKTIIQSSGTSAGGGAAGTRGDFDLLSAGYGIPEEWIGTMHFITELSQIYPIVSNGSASLAELVGGMLVLTSRCLVQRRDADGVVVLDVVSSTPEQAFASTPSIGPADVETGAHGAPQLMDGPNVLEVDPSAGPYTMQTYTVKSVARIQQEGTRALSLKVPGMLPQQLVTGAADLLHRGRGSSAVTLGVAPWVSVQVGDSIKLTTAHPTQYDFGTATRKPATASARVVGYKLDLWTGKQTITAKLGALLDLGITLCPTWKVESVVGAVVTVSAVTANEFELTNPADVGLRDGESVTFYRIGYEGSYQETGEISSISGNVMTLNSAPSGWVGTGSDIRVTYPDATAASSDQDGPFMYVTTTKVWV